MSGNGAVTPKTALRLERAFGSAQPWLGRQAALDLGQVEQARVKLAKQIRRIAKREAA